MDKTTGILRVPGAQLRYEKRGSGPLLLILQGGDGDAGLTEGLANELAADHTVVTYDRRGVSRSALSADGARSWSLHLHGDDVHRLLTELARDPVIVLGSSIGAMIGLELAARHPEQLRALVAHEPPAMRLLPEPERMEALTFLSKVMATYEEEGAGPAMTKMLAYNGIDPAHMEVEPGARMLRPSEHRTANMELFLGCDLPAVRDYEPDVAALKSSSAVIVPAMGRSSGGIAPHRCAQVLGALLERPVVDFPGGHNGLMTHPRAFADRLREVLADQQL